ncbi:hypothetical protein N5D48_21055 [Pseudomonas sp. GD03858]|uniref:hypothetical protein n=1 Tax=unclassified Pseudomonas TaxID=196821 RepID=UPI00244D60F2|nr:MULTISPECIES: hypothetical protein [unclassified Pseudomonas]MDH0649504.1 hypothetical protein [Pseudomonas sp. GD03867]MDH0664898.1 hypothetical protein [Pseudomonas sp. GD03858]
MSMGLREDLVFSALIMVALWLSGATLGYSLYLGAWYAMGLYAMVLMASLALRAPALFITGATAALAATLLAYLRLQAGRLHPDGLLGLGHVFSAPGLLAGLAATAWLIRRRVRGSRPWKVAVLGFCGSLVGFALAQLLVCNSVMHCGPLPR